MTERRARYRVATKRPPATDGTGHGALAAIYAAVTEDELLRWVVDLARTYGLLCYHTHTAKFSAAGYPDICLVPDPARWSVEALANVDWPLIRLWELKAQKGVLSEDQSHWQAALQILQELAPDVIEYRVVRPSDKAELEAALARMVRNASEEG